MSGYSILPTSTTFDLDGSQGCFKLTGQGQVVRISSNTSLSSILVKSCSRFRVNSYCRYQWSTSPLLYLPIPCGPCDYLPSSASPVVHPMFVFVQAWWWLKIRARILWWGFCAFPPHRSIVGKKAINPLFPFLRVGQYAEHRTHGPIHRPWYSKCLSKWQGQLSTRYVTRNSRRAGAKTGGIFYKVGYGFVLPASDILESRKKFQSRLIVPMTPNSKYCGFVESAVCTSVIADKFFTRRLGRLQLQLSLMQSGPHHLCKMTAGFHLQDTNPILGIVGKK